eukprot:m.460385 g.460385  ORF g.460385 m.460385 type:complete len:168 (+) comp20343_c0_seq23:557-1060(+)
MAREDAAAPNEANQDADQAGDDADDDDGQSAVAPSSPHSGAKRQIANEAQQTVASDHGSDDNDATMTQPAEPRRSKRLKAADAMHAAEPPCERLRDDVYGTQTKIAQPDTSTREKRVCKQRAHTQPYKCTIISEGEGGSMRTHYCCCSSVQGCLHHERKGRQRQRRR